MSKKPQMKAPPRRPLWAVYLLVAAAIVGGLFLLRSTLDGDVASRSTSQRVSESEDEEGDGTKRSGRLNSTSEQQSDASSTPASTSDGSTQTVSAADAPPEREFNAIMNHMIDDFRKFAKPLDGYKMENVVATEEGLTLKKADGDTTTGANTVRRGTLESPTIPLAHPSNAVQPIWRAKAPDGSGVNVEVALSADQQTWSQWYPIMPTGDDISPTYPDGRPNPNYGATPGGVVANGLDLYPYARYRVTLTATDENAPVLEEFKISYLDSTEGMGRIPDASGASSTTASQEIANP